MQKINEIHEKITRGRLGRWLRPVLILVGAAVALLLVMTMETGDLHAQARGFSFKGALVRVITPNNDSKNDLAILCYENPKDSDVSGRIFDLRGHKISPMARVANPPVVPVINSCQAQFPPSGGAVSQPEALTWDGRAAGGVVSPGVYIYQIKAEGVSVTGTIVVVR